jgi:hypothetical protein
MRVWPFGHPLPHTLSFKLAEVCCICNRPQPACMHGPSTDKAVAVDKARWGVDSAAKGKGGTFLHCYSRLPEACGIHQYKHALASADNPTRAYGRVPFWPV